jgi:adenylyltransferase/sulfurtransferase
MSGDSERGVPRRDYSRSILFPGIGEEGQRRIGAFSIAFVGIGAVGAAAAEEAARAGFGRLTLIDRDVVEPSNLARQLLFDAEDAARVAPKADAAAVPARRDRPRRRRAPGRRRPRSAQRARAPRRPRPRVRRLGQLRDAPARLRRRALAGDAAPLRGVRGRRGPRRADDPGRDAVPALLARGASSLRLGPDVRHGGRRPDAPAARGVDRDDGGDPPGRRRAAVARNARARRLGGSLRTRRLFEDARPSPACPACARGVYPALEAGEESETVKLCGRQSVQVKPSGGARADLPALEARLSAVARVRRSPQLLHADLEDADVSLTVFQDGRCVVRGTGDPARARAIYDRYVG